MKILIVSQRYWPENFRITDIAETLVQHGHDVTVLTGLPNYPKGYVFEGYRKKQNRIQNHNGVKIIRVREIERRNNLLFRFLNYWSFKHYGSIKAKKLPRDFDVVLINELSPIQMCIPGLIYAKKNKKPVLMYEMDLWPESLLAGGIRKKSLIYKYYKKLSGTVYSKCNRILVSTSEHINYIKELPHCSNVNIECLPQYAENVFLNCDSTNLHSKTINLMFAGNIGKAQSIDTIIKAANIVKNDDRFKFHIVGSGTELEKSKKLVESFNLSNIYFYGNKPLDEMPKMYEKANAMLVTLENKSYSNMTIPGKVQSYMAAGKPIIGAVSGSSSNFIKDNEIGYSVESGDYNGLAKIIQNLNINELIIIGKHAREIYLQKYSKERFILKLMRELDNITA